MNVAEALRRLFRCDRRVDDDEQHRGLMRAVSQQRRHALRQTAAFRRAQREDRLPTYDELYGPRRGVQ